MAPAAPTLAEAAQQHADLARVREHLAAGRIAQARAALHEALALPPRDADEEYQGLLLIGDLLAAEGDVPGARAAYHAAQALSGVRRPRSLDARLAALDGGGRWRLDLDWGGGRYTGTRGSEHIALAELGYRHSPRLRTALGWTRAHAFDALDHGYRAALAGRPLDAVLVRIDAGWTPDAQFSAQRHAHLRLESRHAEILWPFVEHGWLRYPDGSLRTLGAGARLFIADVAVELRHARTEDIDGSWTGLSGLRLDAFIPGRHPLSLYAAAAAGEEGLPPQSRARLWRLSTGAGVALHHWELRASLGWEERRQVHRAQVLSVGLSRRF